MALEKNRYYSSSSGSGKRSTGSRDGSRSKSKSGSILKHPSKSRNSNSLLLLTDVFYEVEPKKRSDTSSQSRLIRPKRSTSGSATYRKRTSSSNKRYPSVKKGKKKGVSDSNIARDIFAVMILGAILFSALSIYLPLLTDNPQPVGLIGASFSDWLSFNLGFTAYFFPVISFLAWGAFFFPELTVWRGVFAWGLIVSIYCFLYGGIFQVAGEAGRITTERMDSLVGLFYPILLAITFIVFVSVLFKVTVLAPAARAASQGVSIFSGMAKWLVESFQLAFSPVNYDVDEEDYINEGDYLSDEEIAEAKRRKRWEEDAVEVNTVETAKNTPTIGSIEQGDADNDEPLDDTMYEDFDDEDISFVAYAEENDDATLISDEDIEFRVESDSGQVGFRFKSEEKPYELPPLILLKDAPFTKNDKADLLKKASIIGKTLADFKIDAHVNHIQEGPRVTRYEIEIGPGINVSKIHNIADNLALELAVSAVRVEAPIPGKSAVGIEVPNQNAQLVTLKSILESPESMNAKGICTICLGRDIAGKPVVGNLAKMPHLLVAGATGSGKSVCLNTLIVSILFKASPEELKLVLIDPKWVELSIYKDLPHLITPVVHTKAEIIGTFGWLIKEMERRYRELQNEGAKNIASYNALVEQNERLPYIIVVVDELADLFMMAGKIAEKQITRIAQKARAVGIHLVVATQRPDVKVITGTIKANIPSRIAFAVAQQVDSRTILDMNGAEKLLGEGDMLYNPIGAMKPFRVQGAFVSDEEVNQVVEFICAQRAPEFNEEIAKMIKPDEDDDVTAGGSGIEAENLDSLYYEAREIVITDKKCSISWLQRRLRIGYQRSARIVDSLVREGIVEEDPETGSYKVANL